MYKDIFQLDGIIHPESTEEKSMNMFFSQKLGIIQAVLQTLNAKFQNTKIGITIYNN